MNNSANISRPGISGAPIKKAGKHLDELDFLTPNKTTRKTTGTPSGQSTTSSRTPGPSAQRDLISQHPPSSPFSPALKPLVGSSSTTAAPSNELTPSSTAGTRSLKPSELRATFVNRLERFKILESLNTHLPSASSPTEPSKPRSLPLKFDFTKHKNPEKFQYRYMYEKLSDRSDVLDRLLEEAAMTISDWYEIEEWADPSVISQEDIWAYGRICAETQDSKISDQACWLETSRMIGHGRRIRLQWADDLKVHGVGSQEEGIGLFPGAIVGLRGRNGGGTYFSVQEILSMPMAEGASTNPKTLLSYLSNPSTPISLVVACGPFTWDNDLDFVPFEAFIDQLILDQPDCVILLGPFIDTNHTLIKTGNITQMPSTIFREKISSRLHKLVASSPRTHVILIPSPRDLLASQVVYPQAALNIKDPELGLFGRNIVCLPNPSIISINEVIIGINNVDVLMPLKKEEFFKQATVVVDEETAQEGTDPNATNVICRACRHVMRQRSFYPLFPHAIGNGFDAINLDVTHLDLLKHDTVGADILILPTNFTAFVKSIDSTVVVNPRQLCKSRGTGTFAHLTIHSFNHQSLAAALAQSNEDEDGVDHVIFERCRADIIKL
ncbi:DNA-directed DNA polymerase alpha subunit pol12 [Puccinia graminis f. sp. tritici]|uniref:DNA polymerase alpha subunit B n=1 Tax=Puccinia graminis f. sp. tritici TaxID=56615 RepID=A0A5B0PPL5_PUCGR|nr:DNA-directed DNA polymerase alpha subunit pol12 [Puccinia graminis f. sp. tritici]KAA1101909.1 DNA-directed DNA polymerase alpha subunit pol12 [Puccinia graminis f. sp. tritici]